MEDRGCMEIKKYKFSKSFKEEFNDETYKNYPVVYILNNTSNVYIGETTSVVSRMNSHLTNPNRKGLKEIQLILSKEFHQSATYNIETNLINYFIAEGKYKLQNISQTKQKVMHDYLNKDYYDQELFGEIWETLIEEDFVTQTVEQLENKDIFKISPYKSLSFEQAETKSEILDYCKENIGTNTKSVFIVQGEAGTGKTVLISSLYNTIQDMSKLQSTKLYNTDNYLLVNHNEMKKTYDNLSKVLPNIKKKNIQKPTSFLNKVDHSNITIVDEAHLLLTSSDVFNGYHGNNHLEDIIEKSDITILIFDPKQYLKICSYWDESQLECILKKFKTNKKIKLVNQLRMNASFQTLKWMDELVEKKISPIPSDNKFELQIFESAKEMHEEIRKKNDTYGLSRVVSTFDFLHKKDGADYFVETSDFKLPWNRSYKSNNWAEVDKTIDEVGSIYTIQGFDLNYVGVILGPSVKYDELADGIKIDITEYKDKKAFSVPSSIDNSVDIIKVKEQIILNSINILLKRGIKGTYIYAYDEALRNRLMLTQNKAYQI